MMNLPVPNYIYRVFLRLREFWKRLPLQWLLLLSAALVSVCAHPVLFVYFHNIQESVVSQVFKPILVFTAVGFLAWIFFWFLSGRMSKGALITLFFMLVFMNYTLIDASIRMLIPDWRWWRIAPIFLFLFINLSVFQRIFVNRPERDSNINKITISIGAVFLALTVFNAGAGILNWIKLARIGEPPTADNQSPEQDAIAIEAKGKRPNFYFFIFDEYARQDILKKYAHYDNTPFLSMLESKKFNVSYSSFSTSIATRVSIGNSLSFSHEFRLEPETMHGIKFPPLLNIFKKAGYLTYVLSPVYRFDGSLVDVMMRSTELLSVLSVEKTVMEKSFFAYLHTAGNEAIRSDRLSLLKQAAKIIEKSSPAPKFLFFHLLLPHEPFVFDENGGSVSYENMNNWMNPEYYAGQLRFVSEKMEELADIILRSDPDAVVLMQSDHGARAFNGMTDKERLASFNSLYLSGQDEDIEGLSTINTLRLALNHALGLKLKMLED
jgi:hypothetical protein